MSLDSSFRKAKAAKVEKRRQRRNRRIVIGLAGAGVAALAVLAGLNLPLLMSLIPGGQPEQIVGPDVAVAPADVYVPAIVDLAGDPLRISIGEGGSQQATRTVPRPASVPAERVTGQVALLDDTMITQSQRFMTTLPSSPTDFAFYQAQRVQLTEAAFTPEPTTPAADATAATPTGPAFEGGEDAGWGEAIPGTTVVEDTFAPTAVANTTSVAVVRGESGRFRPDNDYFVKVLVSRTFESLVAENRLNAQDGTAFAEAMKALISKEGLEPGDVVAIRGMRDSASAPPRIMQVSLYTSDTYLGTLARSDEDRIVLGTDPWVFEDLFNYTGQEDVAQPGQQYRLLDAIYSTAVRNQVPTGVLGEAIMLLSRSFDLNAFASKDDRLILAYAKDGLGDAGGLGRVLYAAVKGTDRNIECYVFRSPTDAEYSCFSDGGGGGTATPNGMFTPVNGVLTSTFGPRMHPIFKEVRVHTGVDWAAPTGTPVFAAFAGTITAAGDGQGYGNLIRVGHPDGRETRYAHLSKFEDGIVAGKAVLAGEVIGYVGTTGNSTGPHLHFELRVAEAPVDPLATDTVYVASSDAGAVDQLTERIVQVESGGNATAQNPLSTATGAGQFIKSTWVRMMKTYRPDLAGSMTEEELLALRNDPTLSREMVQNLAREGEAYLKARGHQITAGRLYLCHFLGMEDAHRILSTEPAIALDKVLTASVLNANPFLIGKDVAYVEDWAERKMSGSSAPSSRPRPVASPEFQAYRAAIAELLTPPVAPGIPAVPEDTDESTEAPSTDTAALAVGAAAG
jgi:murein DD-endopeptidase MepM/ murein hydrolase activator NlpD